MLRIFHRVVQFTLRPFIEFLYLRKLWFPTSETHKDEALKFATKNSEFWDNVQSQGPKILVQGHLSEYGPNYLFRTGLAAKSIQNSFGGGEITVLFNGFSHQWELAILGYKSFFLNNWIFLGQHLFFQGPFIFAISTIKSIKEFFKLSSTSQIIDIRHGGIKVGDLIYDGIMKRGNFLTIERLNLSVFIGIFRSFYYYYQYKIFFENNKFDIYVACHSAYPEYGLLCRVALQKGLTVIETTNIHLVVYKDISDHNLPTYHQGISREITHRVKEHSDNAEQLRKLAKDKLENRLNGKLDQIDANAAYTGKIYSRTELLEKLNVTSSNKIGWIMAHIFVDSPHLSDRMVHDDYYVWLKATIESCSRSPEITWVVKPHPASTIYNENGLVDALVNDAKVQNIYLCPEDFNTKSLINCADIIVTSHGTVGLEYSCLGIPVIVAGTPFWSEFGFCYKPESQAQYHSLITGANLIGRLTQEEIDKALLVFAHWDRMFDWNNPVITGEVLGHVWGNEDKDIRRDLGIAYNLLSENLTKHKPQDLILWKLVAEHISQSKMQFQK